MPRCRVRWAGVRAAGDRPQRGALARPVGAQEAYQFALLYLQIQTLQRRDTAVAHPYALQPQQGCPHQPFTPR
jgi:hypothetical protein